MSSMYIRTKYGVFGVTKDTKGRKFIVIGENKTLLDYETFIHNESDIINQSENLEELCDMFVLMEKDAKPIIFKTLQGAINNRIYNDETIYGAMWTDKGLIYIVKMNEDGKLELI